MTIKEVLQFTKMEIKNFEPNKTEEVKYFNLFLVHPHIFLSNIIIKFYIL